jgi:hypothetical protein
LASSASKADGAVNQWAKAMANSSSSPGAELFYKTDRLELC